VLRLGGEAVALADHTAVVSGERDRVEVGLAGVS